MAEKPLRTVQAWTLIRNDVIRRGDQMHRVADVMPIICPVRPQVDLRLRAVDDSSVTHMTVDATTPVAVLVVV